MADDTKAEPVKDADAEASEFYKGWDEEKERILIEWADKAKCFKWLHEKSHKRYWCINAWFTIPVIIISTLSGVGNFGLERFDDDHKAFITMMIGTISIVAGMITTIQQFLKISETSEGHKTSKLTWDKFYRDVRLVLSKRPTYRKPATDQISAFKEQFDRMMEGSPSIDNSIINDFNKEFTDPDLIKPEICGNIEPTAKISDPGRFYKPGEMHRDASGVELVEKPKNIIDQIQVSVE